MELAIRCKKIGGLDLFKAAVGFRPVNSNYLLNNIFYCRSFSQVNRPIDFCKRNQASIAQTAPSPRRIQTFIKRTPVNCPAISRISGMIRKTAACWDSSTLCALAEPRTIRVTAISDIAGESSSITTSQLTLGTSSLPIRKNNSASMTRSIAVKEIRETSILKRKEAHTFA